MSAYGIIQGLFRLTSGVFYASFDVRGAEHIPADGEPTLLVFNHGNSLGDSVVLISTTPRPISFCAKDTVFNIPLFGAFIRNSGAIPVYRRREHGDKAKDFNANTFRAVYDGLLLDGKCIAFAPEGVSRFVSYATKFKSGVAFIAIETLLRARDRGDKDFTLNIQPSIMCWTHREKFRSDALVRFEKPIKLTLDYLEELHPEAKEMKVDEVSSVKKTVAKALIKQLESIFVQHIISSPDWISINLAITAVRIHRPLGTYLSLSSYFSLLYGWLEVLKNRREFEEKADDNSWQHIQMDLSDSDYDLVDRLFKQLKVYQDLLDSVRIKDERFRRLRWTNQKIPLWKTVAKVVYRAVIMAVLLVISIPGLILWSPFWSFIKRKERNLLQNGRTWADSIAENKMMYGAVFLTFLVAAGSMLFSVLPIPFHFHLFPGLLVGYLWITLRCYEEFVACGRSIGGHIRLAFMSDDKIKVFIEERKKAEALVKESMGLLPDHVAKRIFLESGEDVRKTTDDGEIRRQANWMNFNPFRRRKKDWNELLRLEDYCTMDYVE